MPTFRIDRVLAGGRRKLVAVMQATDARDAVRRYRKMLPGTAKQELVATLQRTRTTPTRSRNDE